MKKYNTVIDWTCPKCSQITQVTVYPFYPGNFSGPPEDCYPDEWDGFEPSICKCGMEIDKDIILNMVNKIEDYYKYREEN